MTLANRAELVMARRQVRALIAADPVTVIMRRREKVDAPGGGWVWSPERNLEPQTAMLIPFTRRLTQLHVNTELGDVVKAAYVLLGPHTLDAERNDRFQVWGEEFIVKSEDIGEPEVKSAMLVDYYAREGGEING